MATCSQSRQRVDMFAYCQRGQGAVAVRTDFEADGCPLAAFRKIWKKTEEYIGIH